MIFRGQTIGKVFFGISARNLNKKNEGDLNTLRFIMVLF